MVDRGEGCPFGGGGVPVGGCCRGRVMAVTLFNQYYIPNILSGSKNGFVSDMDLVFEGRKHGDYHVEMNGDVFLEWFQRTTLSEPSCIV